MEDTVKGVSLLLSEASPVRVTDGYRAVEANVPGQRLHSALQVLQGRVQRVEIEFNSYQYE